jgi:hypothetical protein
VPIGALLGPEFAVRSELFGPDRFHPSAEGYATAAAAMLPALASAAWQISRDPSIGPGQSQDQSQDPSQDPMGPALTGG